VNRPVSTELEFDKVLAMVAYHAATRAGRQLIEDSEALPALGEGLLRARLTLEVQRLHEEAGALPLRGVDEAVPWLAEDAPAPREVEDLMAVLGFARRVASVRRQLIAAPPELELLRSFADRLPDTRPLVQWAGSRLGRDGRILDTASPELARLRGQQTRLRPDLMEKLEGLRKSLPAVVTDAPPTQRRDRYCLPVRAGARAQLPGLVLDTSASGATAFVEPFEVVELNNALAETIVRVRREEERVIAEIAAAFAEVRAELSEAVDVLAGLDAAQARARFGARVEGRVVLPQPGAALILRGARHPLLDERLEELRREVFGEGERRHPGRRAVPLDFTFPEGVTTLVITGPNAGGKTVVLKTIGLMVLLAHNGIPLPVDEGTSIEPVSHLWCHIGDEQDVSADLSTFSAAMAATAELFLEGDGRTLVLYDELGAGTDPLEGAALGASVLEELTRRGCRTVATTHLASIPMLASSTEGMDNAAMEFDEGSQMPTYSLRMGRPGRSRGLEIAASMGLPEALLDRSRELLGGQHLELDRWLRRLEQTEAETRRERESLREQTAETAAALRELEVERARIVEERSSVRASLLVEREALRRRARERLDLVLEKLRAAEAEGRKVGRRLEERLRAEAARLDEETAEARPPAEEELRPGEWVHVSGLGRDAVLEEVRGSKALVQIDDKRLWVDVGELQAAVAPRAEQAPRTSRTSLQVDPAVERELNLLGKTAEEAREEVERFLDRAFAAGRASVRVVHGHGTGTLRKTVAEVCRAHPGVRGFRHPPRHLGGTGATEVELESLGDA